MSVSIGLGNYSKKHDQYTIRLRYRSSGISFIWDIEYRGEKLRCSKDSFNPKKQRLSNRVLDHEDKNLFIQQLCNFIPTTIREILIDGYELTKENILERFFDKIGQSNDTKKPILVSEYILDFLDRSERGEIKNKKGKNLELSSMRIYKRLYRFFSVVYPNITFNHITIEWVKSVFYPFLEKEQVIKLKNGNVFSKKALQPDSIQGIITRLCRIMRLAVEDGISTNRVYETERFKALIPVITFNSKKKDGKVSYILSDKQIIELFQYQSNIKSEIKVRDLFLLMCYTSLRLSDALSLKKEEIIVDGEDYIIKKPTKKTGEYIEAIIIHDIPKSIVRNFLNEAIPTPVAEGYFNTILKQIAKKLNWNEVVISNRIVGGVKHRTEKRLYEVISSHFARRTCITNLVRKGLSAYEIQGISGHQTISMIELYDKRKEDERRESIKNKLRAI